MVSLPFISVLVLNYNGARFLRDCLPALRHQNYPPDRYEVVVVDNASTDGSTELVHRFFPWVKLWQNPRNWGFARGNNAAIRGTLGEYVALLNNDTIVGSDWLRALVEAAESDSRVGICSSKMVLRFRQIELEMESPCQRDQCIQVLQSDAGHPDGVVQYLDGLSRWEGSGENLPCWMRGRARVGVPVTSNESAPLGFRMRLAASQPVAVQVSANGHRLTEWRLDAEPTWHEVIIPPADLSGAAYVIQNAGSRVYMNGAGEDRGTVSREGIEFYETDHGQYDQMEQVFAACGGSCLLRRAMLDEVGLLDQDFFAYYEDTDLSWRAHLLGWKVLYVPASLVLHVHRGTSRERTSRFYFYVFRNRLAMLLKNAALTTALAEWVRFGGWTLLELVRWLSCTLQRRPEARIKLSRWAVQVSVCLSLLGWLPRLIVRRAHIQRRRTVPQSEIDRWLIPMNRGSPP